MASKAMVDDFLEQRTLAVIGVSRSGKGFGWMAFEELRKRGYRLLAINAHADEIKDIPCWRSLKDLPEPVDGLLAVVPPSETEKLVHEAKDFGIKRIWMQPGAESPAARAFCEQNGINVVTGECILLHAEPVESYHRIHRWLWGLFGKLPK